MILKKRTSILVALFLLVALPLQAQKKIKLWKKNDATRKEKWSELSIFLPKQQNSSRISVIICPGGSYYWLDMDNEGFSVAKFLNKHGITAFVLKYRTAKRGNHYPTMIQDLQQAMFIVKENAEKYGINSEKLGLMGFSAGGHLVGTAAVYFDTIFKPYFTAMIYPVISMEDSICHKKSRKNLLGKNYPEELKQKMSLELNVYETMPPIFLLHCINDKTVDYRNSVAFEKALIEKNVNHKFLLFDEYGKGGHGFGINPNGQATAWVEELLKWIIQMK